MVMRVNIYFTTNLHLLAINAICEEIKVHVLDDTFLFDRDSSLIYEEANASNDTSSNNNNTNEIGINDTQPLVFKSNVKNNIITRKFTS